MDDLESNPFASPRDASFSAESPKRGFSVLAVILGWLTDIIASTVLGIVLIFIFAADVIAGGAPPTQMEIEAALRERPTVHVIGMALGCLTTILGGFVAAKVAKAMPYRHALVMGILSLVLGLVSISFFPPAQPISMTIAGFVVVVPCALLGAHLWAMRNRGAY